MANMAKLTKAFEAYINNDTKAATQAYREFFIESAQEINKQQEEELEESFGGDMEDDLYDEVSVDAEPEIDAEFDLGDEPADEFDAELEVETEELPSADEWSEIQDAFDELEALFAELGGGDAELDFEEAADDVDGEDEIIFGDEDEDELKESFEMKTVADPKMKTEQPGTDVNSTVAKKAKSPMGVKGTDGWSADGKVSGSNTKLDTSAPSPKVEDHNNVLANGKAAYKKHAAPTMKGETAGTDKQSIQKDIR